MVKQKKRDVKGSQKLRHNSGYCNAGAAQKGDCRRAGFPNLEMPAKMVRKLKTLIKDLRYPRTFAIARDPRRTRFSIHQVWNNCHVIGKHQGDSAEA